MAERALKKVEDRLNCSICLDTYTDPKLLQCFHEYCQKCLVKLVVRDEHGRPILTCPICRQVTPVPANGVAGLPPAFRINELLEIVEEHKKASTDPPASAEEVGSTSTSLAPHGTTKFCCPQHDGKEVELYCETCEEPICVKCALKGGKHHSHECKELNELFQKYKVDIRASLKRMKKQLTTTKKALAQLDSRCGEISDQRAAIEADVHKTFRQLRGVLNVRETQVISELHQMTQRKLKNLAVQRDQIEITQVRIDSCIGFMKESLEMENRGEVLTMKTAIVKQAKELITQFPRDIMKPSTEANMVFSASADLAALCREYGRVYTSGSPDPSNAGKDIEEAIHHEAIVAETSTAIHHEAIVGETSTAIHHEAIVGETSTAIHHTGTTMASRTYQDILESELHFPSFRDLSHERGLNYHYWKKRGVWTQACTWCFIAEITNNDYSQIPHLRNRVLVLDRRGQDNIPILYYPECGSFDFKTQKIGHTICVMMAQKHHFLDFSIGLRIEDLDTVKVIPIALADLLTLSTFCSQLNNACWACDRALTVFDKKCSACHTAEYCSKECQVKDWKERHRKWCKALPEFLKMTKIDYSKYDYRSLFGEGEAGGRIW